MDSRAYALQQLERSLINEGVVELPIEFCRQRPGQKLPPRDDQLLGVDLRNEAGTSIQGFGDEALVISEKFEPVIQSENPYNMSEDDAHRNIDTKWKELENEAMACRACRLAEGRSNVVFGVGNRMSPAICFVGEGPGADEDRLGEPFVGRAGQLLTRAIENGLKLKRSDVYICNVVKCRPPENRTPLPDEVSSCFGFLERQLKMLNPSVIVTLGAAAQLALCGEKLGITKLRGKWLEWSGIPVMPTLHPAYLLRNPSAKKEFWEDLQLVMKRVGLTID